MKPVISAGILALVAATAPAMADHGPRDSGINQRQHMLEQRIERGWRSGELTPREYRRLHYEARDIDRAEHFFRADGWLSPREREELHARLDDLARALRREMRDGERGYGSYNYSSSDYRRY